MMNVGLVMPQHPNQAVDLKHPAIRNWFWAREMFRRLGFPAEDLYFCVQPTSPPRGLVVSVVLRVADREFQWAIGLVETVSHTEIGARYEQWIAEIKQGQDLWDLDEFFGSWAFSKRWELLEELVMEGFHAPKASGLWPSPTPEIPVDEVP